MEKTQTIAAAVLSAGLLAGLLVPAVQAAPIAYEAAVNANNPYVFYRFQETGNLTDAAANDSSLNNRADGIYRGDNLTGGVSGAGVASDTAVTFPDPAVTGLNYLRTTDTLAFGSQSAQSSYELVFKSNTANPTGQQALFGVFNASETGRTNTGAVVVEFNTGATGPASAGNSRFYLRDEDGIALAATFENGTLLDGNYHHVVFTYDAVAAANDYMNVYVDGSEVPVNLVPQGGGSLTDVPDNFLDFTRDPVIGARNVRGTVDREGDLTVDEFALYGNNVLTQAEVTANALASGVAVPEPASLSLLGMAGLGLIRRRRA